MILATSQPGSDSERVCARTPRLRSFDGLTAVGTPPLPREGDAIRDPEPREGVREMGEPRDDPPPPAPSTAIRPGGSGTSSIA